MLVFFSIMMLISVLLIPISCFVFLWFNNNAKKPIIKQTTKPVNSEEQLMGILYGMMEREWAYRVNFHFKLKDIRIPKFEYELNYLVKKIMNAISEGLMTELRYYYTEEAIISIVSEMCQIMLLDYIDKNKFERPPLHQVVKK